jgi:PilZ domain
MADEQSANILTCELQIEVFGADLEGRQFIEKTRTLSISRDGATIPLANKLAPESELIVRNPVTNQETVARVVDLIQDMIGGHVYGFAFVSPPKNLWQVELPEPRSRQTIILECSRCHNVDAVLPGEIEMLILETKQALSRHCGCSNSPTSWKKTDRTVTEPRAANREANDERQKVSPFEGLSTGAAQEKRKEKRAGMKAAACIRDYRGEKVVECEDVSRGGFRFKSGERYLRETRIEAAVPYAKNSVNIFVLARIAYEEQLSDGFYRHGVAYIKTIKRPDPKP